MFKTISLDEFMKETFSQEFLDEAKTEYDSLKTQTSQNWSKPIEKPTVVRFNNGSEINTGQAKAIKDPFRGLDFKDLDGQS